MQVPLNKIGHSFRESRRTSRGQAQVETSYRLDANTLTAKVTTTARNWQSREISWIAITGHRLHHRFARTYYKKKYGLFGPWVEDRSSFDGRVNTRNAAGEYLRLSTVPVPVSLFIESASSRPSRYHILTGNSKKHGVYEQLRRGDFLTVVGEASKPRPDACEGKLDRDPVHE
jgi:hypothetical protein